MGPAISSMRIEAFALPTQFFIDPNGVIASIVGAPLDEAGAIRQIEAILAGRFERVPSPAASPAK